MNISFLIAFILPLIIFFTVLGIEPETLFLLDKCSTTELLCPRPFLYSNILIWAMFN